jgi:hypothetical protein
MKPKKPAKWKLALGLLLLIFSPKHGTFVSPSTPGGIGYDFAGLLWWAFVIWLLWSGFGFGSQPKSE